MMFDVEPKESRSQQQLSMISKSADDDNDESFTVEFSSVVSYPILISRSLSPISLPYLINLLSVTISFRVGDFKFVIFSVFEFSFSSSQMSI